MPEQWDSNLMDKKLRAATRIDGPRPAFVAGLRARLLAEKRRPLNAWQRLLSTLRRPAWAIAGMALALLLGIFLAIGPEKVVTAARGLLGYIPQVGFVSPDGGLLILAEPIIQERDGITVTVTEVVADDQRVIVLLQVDGIRQDQRPDAEDAPFCSDSPILKWDNGTESTMGRGEGRGWPSGYDLRGTFQPVVTGSNKLIIALPCLYNTRPGGAPEDWELPVILKPAPPDFKTAPVVEMATLAPEATTTAAPIGSEEANSYAIHLAVERMAELDNGYWFEGSLTLGTLGEVVLYVDVYAMRVMDALGNSIPIEPAELSDENLPYADGRVLWAIQTNRKDLAGPLTLTLDAVTVDLPTEVSFDLDLGHDPQPGQVWELNQEIEVAGQSLLIRRVTLDRRDDGAFWLYFKMQSDPTRLLSAAIWDPDNHSQSISGEGGGGGEVGVFAQGFSYDYLPTGVRHIQVQRIQVLAQGPWQVLLELPAASQPGTALEEEPQVCVSEDDWNKLMIQPTSGLPEGLSGRLLLRGPAAAGKTFPTLITVSPDGSGRQEIGSGGWASLAPEPYSVIYNYSDGLHIYLAKEHQDVLVSWSTSSDYNPIWSPDGSRVAFVRAGEGIYTIQSDGNGLQRVEASSVSTSLVGWLPDGAGLIVTELGPDGSEVRAIDLTSGAVTKYFMIDNRKGGFVALSPDGKWLAFSEIVFGRPAYGVYVADLDGSEKRLVADPGKVSYTSPVWSPDGKWLWLSVVDPIVGDESVVGTLLVGIDQCQVLWLAPLGGVALEWRP